MGRDATCLDGLTAAGQVRGHLPGIQKGYLNEKKQCKEYPYQRGSAARAGGDDPGGDQGSPDQPVDKRGIRGGGSGSEELQGMDQRAWG